MNTESSICRAVPQTKRTCPLVCFQQVSHHVAHAEKQSRCASRGYCSTIQQHADAARKKGVGPRRTAYSLVLSPHRILSLLASSTRTQPRPLAGGKSRLFCEAASASRWNGPFLIAMQVVGHGADLIRFTHAQPRPAGNSLRTQLNSARVPWGLGGSFHHIAPRLHHSLVCASITRLDHFISLQH